MYSQVIKYPCVLREDTEAFAFETQLIQPSPGYLMTFVHIHVRHWSKTTLRSIEEMWKRTRPTLPDVVFGLGRVTDSKWEKFVTHFGFRPAADIVCVDGNARRIFYHG